MTQITYTDTDKLVERLEDLAKAKDILAGDLESLMNQTNLSKKGYKRVMVALAMFPKPPAKKFSDNEEIAIFTLSTKLRENQLLMLMIINELNNMQQQAEVTNAQD